MPMPSARFMPRGTASETARRKPESTSAVTASPSATTTPMACGQVRCMVATSWKATTELSPMPAASASGRLASNPMAMVATAATSAVEVRTAAKGSLWPAESATFPRMTGLTKRMYAIVMKVVAPAITSVRTLEPRSEIPKKRSSVPLGPVAVMPPPDAPSRQAAMISGCSTGP